MLLFEGYVSQEYHDRDSAVHDFFTNVMFRSWAMLLMDGARVQIQEQKSCSTEENKLKPGACVIKVINSKNHE
jgi:hypothetical protein